MGPKNENAKKHIGVLFRSGGGATAKQAEKVRPSGGVRHRKKTDFSLKMLRVDLQNCVSYPNGEHIFRKIMRKKVPGSEELSPNNVGYIKILPKLC